MIHTNRIVTVGEQESIIDRPIVLYRGDREVEIEFTLVGNEFMFSEEGNVIKSVNASHGQLVLNTPSGEHMFSELAECHEGKVVFVVTKEMIDEFIEMGFYSFQIRLYDSAEMKSRVTIPPVMNGFDIRNPIAAEDETNVVDQGIVDYARIFKDQSNEELPTFTWDGEYVKTEWAHHDVITENKMNKIEDALYSINANIKESDVVMLNALDNVKKDADAYVKEHMAEVEADVEEFERNLNTDVQQFKIDTNASVQQFKIDTNAAMTAHKDEVSEELAHIENYKNNLLNVFEYNKCDDENCVGNCGKVKGNGVHDDTLGLQNAIDYCWDNNIGGVYLPIPIKHYTTTSPLHLWSSSSESVRKKVALVGDGKELTKIVKTTNTCSNLKHHTNIDAVLILVNDYIKNNNSLKEEIDTSGLGICRYNEVSGISLNCVSSSNRVKYGIYSVGWFFARFTDVQFENVDTGMNTLTWNCYSTYDRLRFNRTLNGCDFGTSQIGGQTTMLFQDCHVNGVDGCAFNIRGNATFINCAIDGGGGTHYKAQANYRSGIGWGGVKIVLINCHHESPSVFANNHLFDLTHADAYVYTSSMEIPTYNFTSTSSVIKLTKGSTFTLNDTAISFRLGVEKCPGMLVDKDVSSQFILNNSFIDTEMFEVYKHCVYNQSDCIVLSNRAINTPIVKGVSYIPSNVPTQNIPKPSVERTDTRLVFSSSNNVDSVAYTATYIFTKKVDLTNMAKINVLGDIDLGDVSGTNLGNFKINLFEELPQDDFCHRGVPLSSYLSSNTHDYNDYNFSSTNYSRQNANRFIDVTDVIGEYYIGISISSINATASIKEVKIIR